MLTLTAPRDHAGPLSRLYGAPIYDPAETLAQFKGRQRRAFAAFEVAWRDGRIAHRLKLFYDALVRRVGANAYAWMKETTLAAEFGVSISTIKRWFAALERAQLIRRQRRFATSSLTFITAYDEHGDDDHVSATSSLEVAAVGADQERYEGQAVSTDNHQLYNNDYQQSVPPAVGPANEPAFGSFLRRDSLKPDHLRSVGGDTTPWKQSPPDRARPARGPAGTPCPAPADPRVLAALVQEGVDQFYLGAELQHCSPAEVDAVRRYLDRQRNVHDRPRLFAWLLSRGFGAQLLQGRQRRERHRLPAARAAAPPDMPPDMLKYVSGPLAALVRWQDEPLAADLSTRPPEPSVYVSDPTPPAALWETARAVLRARCPAEEWTTWLQDIQLLAVTATTAVIGTPHVFARDHVGQHYQSLLEEVVRGTLGQPLTVQVVLATP